MELLYLNPYHGGSHAATAESYTRATRHQVALLTLPTDGGWRWRMRGAALTFARMVREQHLVPDLIFTTDMLDLATFRALTHDLLPPHIPAALYMFENQLTYPLPEGRPRDLSFAWTNYTSALVADQVFFNSAYHHRAFFAALPDLLRRYHDYRELHNVEHIAAKSAILPTGIDLARLEPSPADTNSAPAAAQPPVLLWSSRWDYDKQPQLFFEALEHLAARGADFRLIIAGESVDPNDATFVAARERWQARLLHWGYPADLATYRRLLHQADIVVSTAIQETLGIGLLEALFCGCFPILPRRLVYPDLLPPHLHPRCLYETLEDLVERLHDALRHHRDIPATVWRAIAAPYDWHHMAPRYDAALELLPGDR